MIQNIFVWKVVEHLLLGVLPAVLAVPGAWVASNWLGSLSGRRFGERILSGAGLLIPRRTLAMLLLAFLLPPILPYYLLGQRMLTSVLAQFLACFVLAVLFFSREHVFWTNTDTNSTSFFPTFRTALVASVIFAAPVYMFMGKGVGAMIFAGAEQSRPEWVWRGYAGVVAIAVTIDLILGYFQLRRSHAGS